MGYEEEEDNRAMNDAADAEARVREPEAAVKAATSPQNIVKVKYFSETTGELSAREYTYYSVDPLKVDDVLIVPVRDSTGKAKVSAIDIPEAEIAAFADKVKTIPSDSLVKRDLVINLCDTCGHREKYPECEDGVQWGDGIGNDNIIKCNNYLGSLSAAAQSAGAEVTTVTLETAAVADNEAREQSMHDLDTLLRTKAIAIINIDPGHDNTVLSLYKESLALYRVAGARTIKTADDYKRAVEDSSLVSKLKKSIEELRRGYVNPIRERFDEINASFKAFTSPLEDADKINRAKMSAFNAEQERLRREQEQINNLRVEAAQKEAALNNGEISEPVNLVEVQPQTKKVNTQLGSSNMRDNWVYEVTDFKLVPDEYKMVNTATLTAFVKSNKDTRPVPGVRIFNSPIVVIWPR